MTQVKKDSFIAVDENQVQYRLHTFVDMIASDSMDEGQSSVEGLKTIRTDDGDYVNYRGEGLYEIAHNGKKLKKL